MPIKHVFTSAKADGDDATLIRPSDWNADHEGVDEDSIPVAGAGAVIDTTTYDDTISGVGKLTTMVFPAGPANNAFMAVAKAGDAFPRIIYTGNPSEGGYFGDGTIDPVNNGAAWWLEGPDANGWYCWTFEGGGTHQVRFSQFDANVGYFLNADGGISLGGGSSVGLTLSTDPNGGAPTIGGNVGDLFFRKDPGGANQTIYRCTVAGTAGNATWVGIL